MGNTTTSADVRTTLTGRHKNEGGGMSGRSLTEKALEMTQMVYEESKGSIDITSAGGIFTPEDAWKRAIYGGATKVQVYSSFFLELLSLFCL